MSQVQSREVWVVPVPGASMLMGVSSAKTASVDRTWRPMAKANGSSKRNVHRARNAG